MRNAAFAKVAQVAAWSMKHATMGEAPAVGFENEAFAEKSFRGKLAVSKALAKNWRP